MAVLGIDNDRAWQWAPVLMLVLANTAHIMSNASASPALPALLLRINQITKLLIGDAGAQRIIGICRGSTIDQTSSCRVLELIELDELLAAVGSEPAICRVSCHISCPLCRPALACSQPAEPERSRRAAFASIVTVSAIRPRPTASKKSSALAPV